MKINFVTSNLAPFRIDWLDEIAKSIDVNIFYNDDDVNGVNKEYIKRRPKRAYYENISKRIGKRVRIYNIRKIINTPCDLLILDGYGFFSQLLLINILNIIKREFILSVDGGFINQYENKIKYLLKKYIISSAKSYLSTGPETDKLLIYYGANKESIYRHYFTSLYEKDINKKVLSNDEKIKLRRELDIPPDDITIIGVGKFIYGKGFDILLRAIKYIKKDVSILLVGGVESKEYGEIIREEKINNISFIDFCDKEILKKYYDSSDLFVLPTRTDVWGLVINEAMSKGLPVVTTDMCIAGKTLIKNERNGFIVPINDEKSLAEAINKILDDDLFREQIGKNNLDKINQYTIENSAKKDIYNFRKIMGRIKSNG